MNRGLRRGAGTFVVLVLATCVSTASAAPRASADFEFMSVRRSTLDNRVDSLFTIGGTIGINTSSVVSYVGANLGLFTLQGRAGVSLYPSSLYESGAMLRAEVRPQLVVLQCNQPAVFGQLGVGYRWSLQYRGAEEDPGPGFYILPAVEGGPAWLRPQCGEKADNGHYRSAFVIGGTIAAGLDW